MSKFDELREKFPHLSDSISRKEKSYKKAQILSSIKDHEGVKMILDELQRQVIAHNNRLIHPDPLTEKEREIILTDKERCLWLINKFPLAEKRIKIIEEEFKKL